MNMKINTLHSLINAPAIMQIAAANSIIAPAILQIAVAIIHYGAAFSIIVPAFMLIAGTTYVLMIGRYYYPMIWPHFNVLSTRKLATSFSIKNPRIYKRFGAIPRLSQS